MQMFTDSNQQLLYYIQQQYFSYVVEVNIFSVLFSVKGNVSKLPFLYSDSEIFWSIPSNSIKLLWNVTKIIYSFRSFTVLSLFTSTLFFFL